MKTTTYAIPYAARCTTALQATIPAVVAGVAAAVLMHHIAGHGLLELAGDRLPVVVVGCSAWLVAGMGLNAGRRSRVLAHLAFAAVLFAGAVAVATSPASFAAPWFVALAAWVILHRRDIGRPAVAAGWAAFNAALALALMV